MTAWSAVSSGAPPAIHVENWPEEDYMQRALAVLRDAAEENELLQVRLED